MKKNFEKIVTIALNSMSLIFVVFLLIMIFNTEMATEANNTVVHILFIVFASLFAVLAALSIYAAFNDSERVNQILLFKNLNGTKKASVSVIRKLAKTAVTTVPGAKIGSVHVFVGETGDVFLKATLKIASSKKAAQPLAKASVILEQVNAALELEFLDVLNLSFKEIELKLIRAKHYSAPSLDAVNQRVEASHIAERMEAKNQDTAPLETQNAPLESDPAAESFSQAEQERTAEESPSFSPQETEAPLETDNLFEPLNHDWRFDAENKEEPAKENSEEIIDKIEKLLE